MNDFIPWGDSFVREVSVEDGGDIIDGMLNIYEISKRYKSAVDDKYTQIDVIGYDMMMWVATSARVYILMIDESKFTLYQTYLNFEPAVNGDIYLGKLSTNNKDECVFYINKLLSTSKELCSYKLSIEDQYKHVYNVLKTQYEYDKQVNPFHIRMSPMFSNTIAHRKYINNVYMNEF